MQKKYLFAAGILVLCLAGYGLWQYNRGHEDSGGVTPVADLSAVSLFQTFQSDEAAANKKYLGNVVRVSGRVADISMTGKETTVVLGLAEGGVNCQFTAGSSEGLQKIKKGDSLSCKGRCTGFLMDVALSDCVVDPVR